MLCAKQDRGLRTKTGCLTCRGRRKKCDEKLPVCGLCSFSGRHCRYPTSAEQLDRRYSSHHQSRPSVDPPSPADRESPGRSHPEVETRAGQWDRPQLNSSQICLRSEATAHRGLSQDLEAAISRHFIEEYYGLLLLPNCHREFYNGWIAEIQHLMIKHKSLHYSVLANGASHLHSINASSSMQELALMYYSSALRDLSNLLAKSSHLENHNGLLMSVMLLYLHGCMGSGTYADIPRHVGAATRILTMRLLQGPLTITQPFDRLAVESVLYQIFLVTTGLWSENTPLDYAFDAHFWLAAEKLLHRSIMFPGRSNSLNSPVLGAPVSLFRLALSMKQQLQKPSGLDSAIPCHLSKEVEEWEVVVFCDLELDCLGADEEPNSRHGLYRDGSYLYIIIISLLQEQILWKQAPMDYPEMTPNGSWQLAKAFAILRSHRYDDEWKLCFIGNWPIYTLGFLQAHRSRLIL